MARAVPVAGEVPAAGMPWAEPGGGPTTGISWVRPGTLRLRERWRLPVVRGCTQRAVSEGARGHGSKPASMVVGICSLPQGTLDLKRTLPTHHTCHTTSS